MPRVVLALVASVAVALASGAAPAAGPAQAAAAEVSTAITHAGFAAQGADVDVVHLHLHHVVNCLVGVGQPGFDASAGDPCRGEGRGARRDARDANLSQDVQSRIEHALRLAEVGIAIEDTQPARDVARAIKGILEEARADMTEPPGS